MILDKKVWAEEKAYLNRVMNEINNQLDIGMNAADNYKSDAIKLQKSMWEDVKCAPTGLSDLEDVAQINQIQMDLLNKASLYKFSYEKVGHLKRLQNTPYFGRIDFLEAGEKAAERIYIGIHHLSTYETMDILIYDWRAPISSMFYDYEIGSSGYVCPEGFIEGEIQLKRQYKIENSDIVYMFDSSLNINDAMLRDILGKNTDNRMKTIVTSIQKEQNTVIRNSQNRILIVEGPAGSGKTSIALHRAAYLLYKHRDTIKSEDILIFSPNHVFEDYISHVLPELGEENIRRSTFADFFRRTIPENRLTETANQQMEFILNSNTSDDLRLDGIKFKSSPLFLAALKRYVQYLENGMDLKFDDLVTNHTLLFSADEIIKLYHNQYSRLPYANRLEKIRQRLFNLLTEYEDKRLRAAVNNAADGSETNALAAEELKMEYEVLKNSIFQMTTLDIRALYMAFMNNIETFVPTEDENEAAKYRSLAVLTKNELEQGIVNYEDLAPMIYLNAVLEDENIAGSIKHIIIDEAQDYTPVHYEIFKTVFRNCNMTILGDINQTVNGYMNIGTFDLISDTFNTGVKRIVLTKSYRSSIELANFSQSLLVGSIPSEQLNRHGAKPKVIQVGNSGFYKRIAEDIVDLKNKGYRLIAVICKTASQCKAVYQTVSAVTQISLISNQNEVYCSDVIVIPSYLAKGLEFDAVLVNSIEDKDYFAQEDRKLLYTVCTRALHELYLYYVDTMSGFVSDVDKRLYDIIG